MKLTRFLLIVIILIGAALVLSIAGKVTRAVVLKEQMVRYFPKDQNERDLDLAIRVTQEEAELSQRIKDGDWIRFIKTTVDQDPSRLPDIHTYDRLERAASDRFIGREFAKPPVEYWEASESRYLWQGVVDRVDDLSFVNTLAVIFFTGLFWCFVNSSRHHEGGGIVGNYTLNFGAVSLKDTVGVASVVFVFIFAGMAQHVLGENPDRGPLHGIFWTENFIPAVTATQWLDGVLWIIVSAAGGVALLVYTAVLRYYKKHLSEKNLSYFNQLTSLPVFPLLFVFGMVSLIRLDPLGWDLHPISPAPILLLSGVYASYIAISFGAGFQNLPEGYYLSIEPTKRSLFFARVASVSEDQTIFDLIKSIINHPGRRKEKIEQWAKDRGMQFDAAFELVRQWVSVMAREGGSEQAKLAEKYLTDFYSCYISYSHEDIIFADRLVEALHQKGIDCWLDRRQLSVGDEIKIQIKEGIEKFDRLLFCCSGNSLESPWCEFEIEAALEKEERLGGQVVLLPMDLDGLIRSGQPLKQNAKKISGRLAADFRGWSSSDDIFEQGVQAVVRALQAGEKSQTRPGGKPPEGT